MIIAAVIRRDSKILLQQVVSEIKTQEDWKLPNCEVSDGNNPIDSLIEKCKAININIDVTDVFVQGEIDNLRSVVYKTELLSH